MKRSLLISALFLIIGNCVLSNVDLRADIIFIIRILILFIVPLLFYWCMHKFDFNDYQKDKLRLNLKQGSLSKDNDMIEWLLWGRTKAYKNDPRGNKIFIRAIFAVSIVFLFIFLFSIIPFCSYLFRMTLDSYVNFQSLFLLLVGYFSAAGTLYWNERTKYKEKWEYLSSLYNDLLKDCKSNQCQDHKKNYVLRNNAIAIDAIVMMQWGHRSFKELVYAECFSAIKFVSDKVSDQEIASHISNEKFCEREILFLLENYQRALLNEEVSPSFKTNFSNDWYSKAYDEYYQKYKYSD